VQTPKIVLILSVIGVSVVTSCATYSPATTADALARDRARDNWRPNDPRPLEVTIGRRADAQKAGLSERAIRIPVGGLSNAVAAGEGLLIAASQQDLLVITDIVWEYEEQKDNGPVQLCRVRYAVEPTGVAPDASVVLHVVPLMVPGASLQCGTETGTIESAGRTATVRSNRCRDVASTRTFERVRYVSSRRLTGGGAQVIDAYALAPADPECTPSTAPAAAHLRSTVQGTGWFLPELKEPGSKGQSEETITLGSSRFVKSARRDLARWVGQLVSVDVRGEDPVTGELVRVGHDSLTVKTPNGDRVIHMLDANRATLRPR
jgi:hypothetical protein